MKRFLLQPLHPKTVRKVLYGVYAIMLVITWHYASLVMEFQKITPTKLIRVFSESQEAETASVTISGTVYTNEGTTTMGAGRSVRILKNGTDISKTTTTGGGGAYSITGVNTVSEDVLTIYLDNATENGAVVTLSSAVTVSDMNIYQNYLITRTESGTALSNANLDTANNADPGASSNDLTSLYDVSGGTLTTTSGTELLIWTGDSFTPGGAIVAGGTIDNDGTLSASTYAINVAGDWDMALMPSHTGALTFDGTGTQTWTSLFSTGSAIVINKSSDSVKLATQMSLTGGSVTVTSGTLRLNGYSIIGSPTVGASGTLQLEGSETAGTPTLNAGSTVLYSGSSGPYSIGNGWTYSNLTIDASGTTYSPAGATLTVLGNFTMTAGTFTGNSAALLISGNLNLNGGTFTSTSNTLNVGGNFDRSGGGTFTHNSGTVELNGNGQSILGATTFSTLTKTGADTATAANRTLTFTNGQTTTATTANLNGFSNSEPLLLRSNSSGLNASLTATTTNASKLDIKDVYHLDGPIDPANSTSSGNSDGWFTPLTVTAGNIAASLTTDNGTANVAGINDILTITWSGVTGDGNTLSDISTVTADLSNFGGTTTESLYDNQTNGDVTSGDGIFTRAFTIPAGSTDAVAQSFTITATNTLSTVTGPITENTTFTVDNIAPTVTNAKISASITTDNGTLDIAGINDVIKVTWDNSASGDNNTDTISSITTNISAFGSGASQTLYDTGTNGDSVSSDGIYSYALTLASGAIDTTNLNASVTATDNAGNVTTTVDTSNLSLDNIAPIVTNENISASITTDNGTLGIAGIGDVITTTWNNSASGDNNADTISSVTANLSEFGGNASQTLYDNGTNGDSVSSDGIYSYALTIILGDIDPSDTIASITATDNAGNTTTTVDSSDLSVDSIYPIVTNAKISASITTDGGTADIAGINDIIKVTWDNSASGDNNTDTISSVTANLSSFGGGASQTLYDNGTNGDSVSSDGTYSYALTIASGSIDTSNLNASITATDNAGNSTTTVDTSNISVDNIAPTVSAACISVTGATGTNGLFQRGDTPVPTWKNNNPGSGCTNNNSDIASVAFSAANFKAADTNRAGSAASNVWTASLSGAMDTQSDTNNNVTVTATDDAGNATSLAGTNNYTIHSVINICV